MTRADQLHGLVTRAVILGPQAQKDLRLGLGSATTVFKFSVIFKQWVLHFFFLHCTLHNMQLVLRLSWWSNG